MSAEPPGPESSQAPPGTGTPMLSGPPPPNALPEAGWGAGRVFGALGALIVLLVLEVTVISAFDPDLESLAAKLVLQAALAITLLAVALFAAEPGAWGAAATKLGLRRPLVGPVKPAILAYLVYAGCALLIGLLIEPEQEDVTRELGGDDGTLGTIVAGFLIVAVAPLTEEVFFRGLMFAGLRGRAPFAVAALVSGAIWGVFHFTGADSWGVVLQLTVFGVVLAWLYERTGSIWPPVAVHAFNNALAFTYLVSS